MNRSELAKKRSFLEAQLQDILNNPPQKGWPYDAQRLAHRRQRHWDEWFTFLTHPEVKPDNNDAERARASHCCSSCMSAVGLEAIGGRS